MSERSRALEYCPGIGRPFGFTKCECTAPSCSARLFIIWANASMLPALSRARHRATSLGLFTSKARKRSIRWYVSPGLIPSFTGSHIPSTDCTVTGRSRKPVSATMSAVSNFCVLAACRTWSAFFSYKVLPLFASTTITEAALVFGIPSGVNSVGAGIVSGVSFDFARARWERVWVDFDVFDLRVGVGSASASCWSSDELALACLSLALTAFALRTGPETPPGRTASESAASWPHAFGTDARMRTQRSESQRRDNFMGRKLATKRSLTQGPRHICGFDLHTSQGRRRDARCLLYHPDPAL